MSINEHGEIGVLVKLDEPNKLVIHWRVKKEDIAVADWQHPEVWGWKKGDPVYLTSLGYVGGLLDKSDYFRPTEKEKTLLPCINRALDYATKKWPGWRNETH